MAGVKTLITGKSSGEKKLRNFRPTGFSSAGLSGSFDKKSKTFNVTRSQGLESALGDVRSRFEGKAGEFRSLRDSSAFDDLIRGRVQRIRDAGSRTVGNLREQLGQRRVLGSSFAQREIASTEAMFGREAGIAEAEGRLAQLGVETDLIDREYSARVEAVMSLVQQMNLESGLAAQLGDSASQQMLTRAKLRAELDAAGEAAQIDFIATLAGMA